VPHKIQLGYNLTEGLGAGSVPEVGKNAALESINEIKEILSSNTKMVFVTAGMGGGTGTGAAPIIAKTAKEMGILTVGIVTIPFSFEGRKRKMQAEEGIKELKANVDTLIIISNDKLREIHGNLKLSEAFSKADDVLTVAAKSIAEVIDHTLHINLDFNDIRTVMTDSGVAVMGSALASGENRAINAVEQALTSPLLNDSNIKGARYVLVNVTSGTSEISMDELGEISDYIQEAAGQTAEIIQGVGTDINLGEQIKVTVIATGFKNESNVLGLTADKPEIKKIQLIEDPQNNNVNNTETQNISENHSVEEFKPKPLYEEPYLKTTSTTHTQTPAPTEVNNNNLSTEENKETIHNEVISKPNTFEFTFEITNQQNATPNQSETPQKVIIHHLNENNEFTTEVKQRTNEVSSVTETTVNTETTQDIVYNLNEKSVSETNQTTNIIETTQINPTEDYYKKTLDRIQKLKEISFKLKSGKTLTDLETEPAFVRRGINIGTTEHSSENNISRFTLGENDDKKGEIKQNNSYLHDKSD
jgi:cell division protein FtsZ